MTVVIRVTLDFHCRVIFPCVRAYSVNFTFVNKIDAMYKKSHLSVTKSRTSLNLTFNLNTLFLASISLFT